MTSPLHDATDTRLRIETSKTAEVMCITIHGEADFSALESLDAALGRIQLDGTQTLQLNVSSLEFIDVAALRLLTAFAQRARRSGLEVTTCGGRPVLHKVARLFGVQDDLGLL